MAAAVAAAAEAAVAEAWRPSRRHSEATHSKDPRQSPLMTEAIKVRH
jgi:hypothetical protein